MACSRTIRARQTAESSAPSTSTSRPETETEDDGEPDNDVEMTSQDQDTDENMPPPRRVVGIVADSPIAAGGVEASDALDVDDAHIIIIRMRQMTASQMGLSLSIKMSTTTLLSGRPRVHRVLSRRHHAHTKICLRSTRGISILPMMDTPM